MNFSFRKGPTGRMCFILGAFAVFTMTGCGSASKGTVTGTVKFNGQPLPTGTITFNCQEGTKQVVRAKIADGKYTIEGADAGQAKVTVETQMPTMGPSLSGAPASPPADAGKFVAIPPKYSNAEASGLTYDVKGGSQTKDFELAP